MWQGGGNGEGDEEDEVRVTSASYTDGVVESELGSSSRLRQPFRLWKAYGKERGSGGSRS